MSGQTYPPSPPPPYGGNPDMGGQNVYPPQQQNVYPPQQYGGAAPPPPGHNHVVINVHQGLVHPQEPRVPEAPENMAFGEKSIRLAFVRKVYGILTFQLALTFGIASILYFPESVRVWNQENPGLMMAASIMSVVLIIVLACVPNLRRKSPQNFIVLALFTACEGLFIGSVCAYVDSDDVLKAVVATVVIVVGLTLFAFQTKIDFTMASGLLFTLLMGLFVFGIMAAIFQSQVMNTMYAAMGAMLFSAYIVVDTQMILGGKHKLAISPEEYVFAALNLYLDIINLFLMLLRLFGDF